MAEKTEQSIETNVPMVAHDDLVDKPQMETYEDVVGRPHWVWRFAGIGGAVSLLVWAMVYLSDLWAFIDYPSMAIVSGCTFALLFGVFGWKGFFGSFHTLLNGNSSPEKSEGAIAFFRMGAGFALAGGFLGTLIGLIHMLANMSDPSQIGAGIAVAMLTQLYGVFLAVLACTAAGIIARRDVACGKLKQLSKDAVVAAGGISAIGTVSTLLLFAIILISFSQYS